MAETMLRDTLRRAEDDIGEDRPADALTRCHHILAHYPEMLEARRVLGEAYLALNKTREAFQAFDRVLVSDPENTLAYCGRALISQQLGDYESSLDCYYQACELSLGNRQLRQEFRLLSEKANQPDFILSRVGLARLYMRGDLLAHAIREWEQVLQSDAERADARLGLAEAYWRDEQPAKAAEQCKLILQAIPSCLKALLLLGEIAYRAGRLPEASQYLEQARRLDPDGHMARELFADALLNDKALSDFILAEPARIPAMEDRPGEAHQPALSALELLQREVKATAQLPDVPVLPQPPEPPADQQEAEASATFEFAFLDTSAPSGDPPLREGESLEEMLAALIERPAGPEPEAAASTEQELPTDQAVDRLQALWHNFSDSEEPPVATPAAFDPSSSRVQRRTPSTPIPPQSAAEATAGFAKAMQWLDPANHHADEAEHALLADSLASEPTAGDEAAQPTSTESDFAVRRPRASGAWAEEEESEAGWLRWLQAQGARELGQNNDFDENSPFAALLPSDEQPQPPRTVLWEAPDEDFVRSLWPHDTVPQRAVRIAPGSSANGEHANGEDVDALASISSVSLRPLTLEELDRSFSASGLTRLEDKLAALRGNSSETWEQSQSEGAVFTIAEDDFPARLELAERQRKTGRLDEALGHYRAVMRGAPELLDKVIAGLQAAASDAPEQAAIYRLLGDAHTRRGNYMEALEDYHRGLDASRGH